MFCNITDIIFSCNIHKHREEFFFGKYRHNGFIKGKSTIHLTFGTSTPVNHQRPSPSSSSQGQDQEEKKEEN